MGESWLSTTATTRTGKRGGVKNGSNRGEQRPTKTENVCQEIEPPSAGFETPTGTTTIMTTSKLDPQTTLFFLCDVQTKFSEHLKIQLLFYSL